EDVAMLVPKPLSVSATAARTVQGSPQLELAATCCMSASWSGGIAVRAASVGGPPRSGPPPAGATDRPLSSPSKAANPTKVNAIGTAAANNASRARRTAQRPRSSQISPVATRATTMGAATTRPNPDRAAAPPRPAAVNPALAAAGEGPERQEPPRR